MAPSETSLGQLSSLRLNLGLIGIILSLLALLFTACGGPPVGEVIASATSGQAPLSVTFTNSSTNADQFQWDFGDGASATTAIAEEPVTHEYTTAGTHTVTLTATKRGDPPESSTATLTVTVEPGSLSQVLLDTTDVSLTPEQTHSFTATAWDQFDNTISGLTFSFTSDEEAGEVDSQGTFTAGTQAGAYDAAVTVEVTQGAVTKSAAAGVVVEPGLLDHVVLEPVAPTVVVAEAEAFTAVARDQFNNPISGLTFSFTSDEGAGQVDSQGTFTAGTRAGTYDAAVTVEVTQGAVTRSATAGAVVEPGLLDHLVLEPVAPTVVVTEAQAFTAMARDQFDNPISGLTFSFSTVEEAGQVDGQGGFTAGTRAGAYEAAVTVEVTQGAVTRGATAGVVVEPGRLDHVVLEPAATTVEVTGAQGFTATAQDQFDNLISGLAFSFNTDDQAGQVDSQGGFTAGTQAGTYDAAVTVEATQGAVTRSATANVVVEPGALDHVVIDPVTPAVEVTKAQAFTATALDQFDNPISGLTFSFNADEVAG